LGATLLTFHLSERFRASPWMKSALEKLAGVLLIGFGFKLVLSR
jgi:threonine/homoserine/homoserine lactone efflux protein